MPGMDNQAGVPTIKARVIISIVDLRSFIINLGP